MFKTPKILFTFIILSVSNCMAKDTTKQVVNNEGDTPSVIPFTIESKKECLDIEGVKGSLLLSLFVSKEGIIKNFNISHLQIIRGSDTVLTYTKIVYEPMTLEDYPDQTRTYYPYIKSYVDKIVLKPKMPKDNIFYLYLKIGCE